MHLFALAMFGKVVLSIAVMADFVVGRTLGVLAPVTALSASSAEIFRWAFRPFLLSEIAFRCDRPILLLLIRFHFMHARTRFMYTNDVLVISS